METLVNLLVKQASVTTATERKTTKKPPARVALNYCIDFTCATN
jgi:hypothetical protein